MSGRCCVFGPSALRGLCCPDDTAPPTGPRTASAPAGISAPAATQQPHQSHQDSPLKFRGWGRTIAASRNHRSRRLWPEPCSPREHPPRRALRRPSSHRLRRANATGETLQQESASSERELVAGGRTAAVRCARSPSSSWLDTCGPPTFRSPLQSNNNKASGCERTPNADADRTGSRPSTCDMIVSSGSGCPAPPSTPAENGRDEPAEPPRFAAWTQSAQVRSLHLTLKRCDDSDGVGARTSSASRLGAAEEARD